MAGYATLAPALAAGPPGWVVWAVGGTALTIGVIWAGSEVVEMTRERTTTRVEPQAIPRTRDCTSTSSSRECGDPQRYTARVHAQGTDCGGTTGSTIGVPALTKTTPVTVAEGLVLSAGTWALLSRTQQGTRITAKARADDYIAKGPSVGGRLGQKSFPAADRRGGKRYDVDAFGTGPSFVS
jgi:hypothetical protein